MRTLIFLTLAAPLLVLVAPAQTLSVEEWEPKSSLVAPEHLLTRAKFPVINVHHHQRDLSPAAVDRLLQEMDAMNLKISCNLIVLGGYGKFLEDEVESYDKRNPKRLVTFASPDYSNIDDPDYAQRAARRLEEGVRLGVRGLKVWRNLGVSLRDKNGKRVPIDDPRFDLLWAAAGRLKVPVFIHSADPKGFWDPMDKYNERWLELKRYPQRKEDPNNVPWDQLIKEQHHVFAKHPKTIFINAHLGWLGNDLAKLGDLFDKYPNVYTEIGGVLGEIGRQPRNARRFFTKYQDRIVFGKDAYSVPEFHTYFRVLETDDDYIDYFRKYHGVSKIYGLALPDDVLKKIYYKNALKIIPGLDRTGFPD